MNEQCAGSPCSVPFAKFHQYLIMALCAAAIAALTPARIAAQVTYNDFNVPGTTASQVSTACTSNAAPAGVLFCFNTPNLAGNTGASFVQDFYPYPLDPNANSDGNSGSTNYALQLTQSAEGQDASVWYAYPQDVVDGFTVWYAFKISNATAPTGDGLAFVIQSAEGSGSDLDPYLQAPTDTGSVESGSGLTVVGASGGGSIGYGGIDNSIALEADTFDDEFDPWDNGVYNYNGNHMALQSCGLDGSGNPIQNSPAHYLAGAVYPVPSPLVQTSCLVNLGTQNAPVYAIVSNPNSSSLGTEVTISDGNPHQVVMVYNGPNDVPANTLSVYLDPSFNSGTHTPVSGATPIFTGSFNLANYINLSNGQKPPNPAYIGFTAATGESYEQQEIMGFQFSPHNFFGNINVCPSGKTTPVPCNNTIPVNFNENTTVTSVQVLTQGVAGKDFQLATQPGNCVGAGGGICSAYITFAPLAPGLREGAVELMDNGTIVQTQLIYGVGVAPEGAFSPLTTYIQDMGAGYSLKAPKGIAVDAAGDFFVADTGNSRVLEVTPQGTTPVNSGWVSPQGIAIDGAGNVYVADTGQAGGDGEVTEISGQYNITLFNPDFEAPIGVAVDGIGNVFFADNLGEVYEIPAGTCTEDCTPIQIGNGSSPQDVAVDAVGDVFVADSGIPGVWEIPAGCTYSACQVTIGSNWVQPEGVSVDAAGDVIVSDAGLKAVVDVPPGCKQTSCEITLADQAELSLGGVGGPFVPYDAVVDGQGNVYIADVGNNRIDSIYQEFAAVNFSESTVDNPSGDGAESIILQNIGNQPLTAEGQGLAIPNPSFYQVQGTGTPADCTATFSLAAGADCNLSIVFDPLTTGLETGNSPFTVNGDAVFTDNSLNNSPSTTQSIPLTGTSLADPQQFPEYLLTVTEGGTGSGTVTDNMGAISCPATACSANYATGAAVTLTATAANTSTFVSWGGACADYGPNPTCTVTMSQALDVTASFANGDFATANVCPPAGGNGCSSTFPVTFNFQSGAAVSGIEALTEGISGLDFSAPNSNPCINTFGNNGSCTVNITFTPQAPGLRLGAVELFTDSGGLVASQPVYGIGQAPEIAFGPALTGAYPVLTYSSQVNSLLSLGSGDGMTIDVEGNLYEATGFTVNIWSPSLSPSPSPSPSYGNGSETVLNGFVNAQGVAIDGAGNLYVADESAENNLTGHGYVLQLSPSCVTKVVNGSGPSSCGHQVYQVAGLPQGPVGVAVDGLEDVFVADDPLGVFEVQPNGNQITLYNPGGSSAPTGVAVDAAGDVFIADSGLGQVVELLAGCSAPGCPSTTVGSGWTTPYDVKVDAAGDVYVADVSLEINNHLGAGGVMEVPAGCTPQNAASCQILLWTSDGAPTPGYLALDQAGDLFINTGGAAAFVEIVQSQPPTVLNFGTTTVAGTDSSPMPLTYQNIGNQPLSIQELTVPSPFDQVFSDNDVPADCSATGNFNLAAGQICEANIEFEPPPSNVAEFYNPYLTLTSDTLNTNYTPTQQTELVGTAQGNGAASDTIAVTELGSGAGTVTSNPAGITCTSNVGTCGTNFPASSQITLTAAASAGSTFVGWGAPCSGSLPTCTFMVNGAYDVSATFSQQSFGGSVNVCPPGTASVPPCSSTQSVTFNVAAGTTIGAIQVVTQGLTGLDFALGNGSTCTGTFPTATTCNVNVNFTPLAPGLRRGAVELLANNGGTIASEFIYGVGQGPAAAFSPGAQTTVASNVAGTSGVAVDAAGDVFVSGNAGATKIPPSGVPSTLQTTGLSVYVYDVAVDGAGNVILADAGNSLVVKVPPAGVQSTVASAASAGLSGPTGVAVDGAGDVFITDTNNNRVIEVSPSGVQTPVATSANGVSKPYYPAVDAAGDVFFLNAGTEQVLEVTPGGIPSPLQISGLAAGNGVAVDAAGDVFVSDQNNGNILEFTPSSAQTKVFTSGLNIPAGLAVDGAGDVFIADNGLSQVYEVNRSQAPSLNFPTMNAPGTSAAQLVGVQNVGNQTLTGSLSAIYLGGSAGTTDTNFAESGGTCGSFALPLGASCSESFSFTPAAAGYFADVAFFTDNTMNLSSAVVSQAVNLTGIGSANGATGTAVPNVVGMPESSSSQSYTAGSPTASTSITTAGLTLGTVTGEYSDSEPTGSVIGSSPVAGSVVNLGSAVNLLVSTGQAPPPSPNPLTFENNYFVTGDYAIGGATFRTTGTQGITISNTTPNGVPNGVDIIDGILYWTTFETAGSAPSGYSGTFTPPPPTGVAATSSGFPITGQQIGSDVPYTDTINSEPVQGVLRVYRADVNNYFPVQPAWSGERVGSGTFTVSLPYTANGLPITEGASLVVIYRALVAPNSTSPPSLALKSVVIYDGSTNPSSPTSQLIKGFYDAYSPAGTAGLGEVTPIYYSGGTWNGSSQTSVTLGPDASSYTESLIANNAYAAVILSTPVNNPDNDGILKSWKTGPPAGDFFAGQPGYYDVKTQAWVPLPGAKQGEKDLFVQLDWMCGAGATPPFDTCVTGGENLFPSPDVNGNDPLAMVQQAFAQAGIVLHLEVGNAVPESICTDNTSTNPPQLCEFPGEPGVVGWKSSLELSKLWPRNFTNCAAGIDCTARFPYGQKDSYHYVLFGHAVAIPAWNTRLGTLTAITVTGGAASTTTITTTGIPTCPTRITIAGVQGNPGLNGVYGQTGTAPITCGNASTTTGELTTMTVSTPSLTNGWSYPNPTLPEPLIGVISGTVTSISGYSDLGGADSTVDLALWETDLNQNMGTRAQVIAGTLFHEIGHTLGLSHGGLFFNTPNSYIPTFDVNCKSNYQSIMNYLFQLSGLGPNGTVAYSNQTLTELFENSLGSVTQLVDTDTGYVNAATTFPTSSWHVPSLPSGSTESASTMHCDGAPLNGDTAYLISGPIAPITPAWTNNQDITFDQTTPTSGMLGYNDLNNIDLRQVGSTGAAYAGLASALSFGTSSTPLAIAPGGSADVGAGGTVTVGSNGTIDLVTGANFILGSTSSVTPGTSGTLTLNNNATATLSTSGVITPNTGGTVTLPSGGNINLSATATIAFPSSGSLAIPGIAQVTLANGGTITPAGGSPVAILSTGGSYTFASGGGSISLSSGESATIVSGGSSTISGSGIISFGSGGGNVTLIGGGASTLSAGGTITPTGNGSVTIGAGGNGAAGAGAIVTMATGGTMTFGTGGGQVLLPGGGAVTVGGNGNASLAGGELNLGDNGSMTLSAGGMALIVNAGPVTLNSGATINSATAVTSGNTVLTPSSGTTYIVGAGTYTVGSGAQITMTEGGTLTLVDGGPVYMSGGVASLVNGGYVLGGGGNSGFGGGGNSGFGGGGNSGFGGGGNSGFGGGGNSGFGGGGNSGFGGGGNSGFGGGGTTTNEIDYNTANSSVQPPPAASYTMMPASVQVNWMAPAFGVVQTYTISRTATYAPTPPSTTPTVVGPVVIGSVSGVNGYPPATTFTDASPASTATTVVYTIATTLVPDPSGTQRSSAPSPPAVLTLNQTIVLGTLPSSVLISSSTLGVTATAESNGTADGQQVSFSASSPTGACSIAAGTLSINAGVSSATVNLNSTGSCTITASQAGDSTTATSSPAYNAATSVSGTFTILPQGSQTQSQTIKNFASLPNLVYGGSFSVSATSTSGQPVTFSAPPSGACSIGASGGTGTINGVGRCTITASVPGGLVGTTTYSAASVTQSFSIQPATLTVTATSFTIPYGQALPTLTVSYSGFVYGQNSSAFTGMPALSTTATSTSLAGTYPITVSTGTLDAANYSFFFVGGTLTITGSVITASPSSINFGEVAVGSVTTQSVTVSNTGNTAATISTPLISVLKAENANEYVVVNLCPSSLGAAKSCTISVSFVAGAYYSGTQSANLEVMDSAPGSPQTVMLMATILIPQTITFTTGPPTSAVYNSTFTVTATGGASGNPVSLTYAGGCTNPGTTSSSGSYSSTYTMISGTTACSVIANQAGVKNQYAPAATVTKTVTATLAAQTIAVGTKAPSTAVYNTGFTVAATASSGIGVTYGSSGSCTNSGVNYTMSSGSGTCTVTFSQPGNSNYAAATPVTESVSATPATPTITWSKAPPGSAAYGSSFTVTATSNSTGAFTYSVTGGCSISGATVTMTSSSTACTVKATEAATSNYSSGSLSSPVTATLATPTITWSKALPSSATYGTNFTVTATSNSTGTITYGVTGGCSISGATVTMTSGTTACVVTANQAAAGNYTSGSLSTNVPAALATQTITFTTPPPTTNVAYKASFTVAATASSGLSVTLSSSGSCSGSGTGSATYTMTSGTGTCSVIATQAGNSNYMAAPTVTKNVTATYSTATLLPSSLAFTTSSGTQTATLTNTGSTPLVISSIGFTGSSPSSFSQTNTCPSSTSSLAAGAKCTISVTINSGGKTVTANLTVTDNTSAGTQTVSLSGN